MRHLRATTAAALALLLGAAPAFASGQAGGEAFNFLALDANARAVAMGGAYTALATDANALIYNPAGLARVNRNEATFMHNSYFAGMYQEYAGYASPQGWGANFNYLNAGTVSETTLANPNGTGSTQGLSDLALTGGYGRAFGDVSVGASLKMIRESVADLNKTGFAFDFGGLYSIKQVSGLDVGASLLNVGPTVKFDGAAQNLPLVFRAGAGYNFEVKGQKSAASFDIIQGRSNGTNLAFGVETTLAKVMPVRFGFTTANSAGIGLTAGVGYTHQDFAFDYAFVPFGDLGQAHRVSVTWRWGAPKGGDAAKSDPGSRSYAK